MSKVAIFGGGVSGLTTAMELAQRGFEVTVFERHAWGGKVRSTEVPATGTGGRHNLPLEHGFHFFPSFYRHLPDTMSRIPTGPGTTVADNLVAGSQELLTRASAPPIVMPSKFPRTMPEWRGFLRALVQLRAGVSTRELQFFVTRMLQFMTMCPQRREALDHVTWWDFVGADDHSSEYQKLVARMPTQLLLAAPPQRVSARTIGHAFMGMVESGLVPGGNIDRSLRAPPCEAWIGPWIRWLGNRVKLVLDANLEGFECDHRRGRISAAHVDIAGVRKRIVADSYVCALPVEVVRRLRTPALVDLDPRLAQLDDLELTWMCGVQLFLTRPRSLCHGHVAHSDTAWALSSVSQGQFWRTPQENGPAQPLLRNCGDGRVRDMVAVIIGDWERPGNECIYKKARDCRADELVREVIAQFQASLVRSGLCPLNPEDIHSWALDPDLSFPAPHHLPVNAEPLLMSTVGAWSRRPTAQTAIANLFLAGDYVRTQIDFASAEGANEAGRRAANAILEQHRYRGPRVGLWARHEPRVLAPARALDRLRFAQGLPCVGPPMPKPRRDDAQRRVHGEVLAELAAQPLTSQLHVQKRVSAGRTQAARASLRGVS